jgi:hypothetical protein
LTKRAKKKTIRNFYRHAYYQQLHDYVPISCFDYIGF